MSDSPLPASSTRVRALKFFEAPSGLVSAVASCLGVVRGMARVLLSWARCLGALRLRIVEDVTVVKEFFADL